MRARCGLAALAFALAGSFGSAASSQEAASTLSEASRAAIKELDVPSGVGGCIYRHTPLEDRQKVLLAVIRTGNAVTPTLREATERTAQAYAGRSYSASDLLLVGAVTSFFQKRGLALLLAQNMAIGQKRLNAAWSDASDADKTFFVRSAADFLSPTGPVTGTHDPAIVAPFERRLGLEPASVSSQTVAALLRYYAAVAISAQAEVELARQGAKPSG